MRRIIPALLLVAAVLPALPVAAEEAGTPCGFDMDVYLSPGISEQPGSGTFASQGESGKLDCKGTVDGQPAAGRGTIGADGHYGTDADGDSCKSKEGRGDGTTHLTVPVSGGNRHVDDLFTVTYRLAARRVVGDITGRRFSATFEVTAADGDCLKRAITRVHIRGKGLLRDEPPPVSPAAPPPATAAFDRAGADEGGETGTPCAFQVDVRLSPGLSRSPSSGTFRSEGESGTLDCQGAVDGATVTGRGSFGVDGRYGIAGEGDHCRSKTGRGDGTSHFTVPVDGGTRHVDDPFTMSYRVDGRSVVGEITGRRFSATFDVTKADGDCLWHKVTRIRIKGQGHLRSDRRPPPERAPEPGPVPLPV